MTKRPPLNDQQKEQICHLREIGGHSLLFIANKINASEGAVAWYCLLNGIERPRRCRLHPLPPRGIVMRNGFPVRPFTAEDDGILLRMEAEGENIAFIARTLGRKSNSVKARLAIIARTEERKMEECHGRSIIL